MNIDKLIVNCVVDNHTVETIIHIHITETPINCVVDIF